MTKWLAVVGSRVATEEMKRDIRRDVNQALKDGWSIVSGGSTGVDHEAALAVYDAGLARQRLRLYLPLTLDAYVAGFRQRVRDGKADSADTEQMVELLSALRGIDGVLRDDTPFYRLTPDAFYFRNRQIIEQADKLIAYIDKHSIGARDTAERARRIGVPVQIRDYE